MTWRLSEWGWRLLPGGLVTLGFTVLLKLGALQPIEQSAYNALFSLRGELPWDERLVMVTIDDASLRQIGRFPWSRQQYVRLLKVLSSSDPSVIAFDLVWSEPSADDEQLAAAIAAHGRVVLAEARESTGLPLSPVPSLYTAAIATGHILHTVDIDGIPRRINLQIQDEPAFGLAVVKAYSLVQAQVSLPNPDQPLWINWLGRVQKIPQYSFVDVVQGKVPQQTFQNKIVLVGVTATGFDAVATPFDRNPPVSGVHLQAAVINNLLQGKALKPIAQPQSHSRELMILLLVIGPGISLWLSIRRETIQVFIWFGMSLSWVGLSFLLFQFNYWIPVTIPLSVFTLTLVAVEIAERLRTHALLQRQVQRLWQRYQKDLVLRTLQATAELETATSQHAATNPSLVQLAALADQFGRSQSTQAAIARSLSIGLLAADLNGLVWFCNPVAVDWLGIQVGNNLTDHLVPKWFSLEEWQADLKAMQQQAPMPARQRQQGDRWFEIKLEPLLNEFSSNQRLNHRSPLDGFLLVLEDITIQKQAEAALEQQVQELQRLSQMKDDFLSTVSHELRAPMTNIRLAIELLSTSDSQEENAYYLKILQNECNRETELINDLLDLQRLEAGTQPHELVRLDLQTWIPLNVESFSSRAASRQLILQIDLAPSLPAVLSHAPSLERILVELVNNACKYTPPGGVIRVTAEASDADLRLAVTNSGVEIPPTELTRIFDKFYRVPQTDRWQQGGTGLGLALVKRLVEHLNGTIQATSGAGQTTFLIQLPLNQPHPSQA